MSGGGSRGESGVPAPRRKRGCLFYLGCSGLVLLALVALGFWLAVSYVPAVLADGVEQEVAVRLETWKLPPEEQRAIEAPVQRFTERLRSGELRLTKLEVEGKALLARARTHPAPPVLVVRGFAALNLNRLLQGAEHAAALRTVNRFQRAVIAGKVADADLLELKNVVVRDNPESQAIEERFTLRADLSQEEAAALLERLRVAADAAGIPDDEQPIPYESLLDDLLAPRPKVEAL